MSTDPEKTPVEARGAPRLRLEAFLPYRLVVLASQVSEGLAHIYADRYRIGIPEWRVIATLGQFETMTAKAIGAHSHMDKTKVSRAVAALKRRGYVRRARNRADRREAFLSLTEKGAAVYADIAPVALDFADRLFDDIRENDRAAFERVLGTLTGKTGSLRGPDGGAMRQDGSKRPK
jgi:DNA-binding MarR family transcriptional regulator